MGESCSDCSQHVVVLSEVDFGHQMLSKVLLQEINEIAKTRRRDRLADQLQCVQSLRFFGLEFEGLDFMLLHHFLLGGALPEDLVDD